MATLTMYKGLPASGKSTDAKKRLLEGNAIRVNKDDARAMYHNGKWSKDNEKFIIQARDKVIALALTQGIDVYCDDTNLSPKHEARLREIAHECFGNFKVIDFTNVTPEECIKRDQKRTPYVGEKVIRDMYNQYLKPPSLVAPAKNPKLKDCVIVDVDGTIAKKGDRSAFDETRVYEDEPIHHVIDCVRGFRDMCGAKIIFFSGRHETCYDETVRWAKDKCFLTISDAMPLYMRPANDSRKDYIIKRELYEKHILGKYNVTAIFDDRPQVIRECWQYLGFSDRIFNVGTGEEF